MNSLCIFLHGAKSLIKKRKQIQPSPASSTFPRSLVLELRHIELIIYSYANIDFAK